MNIKVGESANIRHFSNNINYIVRIEKIESADLHLEFYKIRKETGINVGDPAVLIYNSDSGIVVKGCIIWEIFRDQERIVVRIDENCRGISKRSFERYPVSFDSDLKFVNESKRYSTFIKDISKYGFKILSSIEIPIGQKIEISPYLNKRIVFITGTIVRSVKKTLYYEYGINVDPSDLHSVQELSIIIKMAQEDYVNAFIYL